MFIRKSTRILVLLLAALTVAASACGESPPAASPGGTGGDGSGDTTVATEPPASTTPASTTPDTTTPDTTTPDTTIADDADLRWIVLPDASGAMPGMVEIGCPSGPTFPASALEEIPPLQGAGLDEVEAAIDDFLGTEEGVFWPQDGWRILHQTDERVLLVHYDGRAAGGNSGGRSGLAFQGVERVDGEWRWTGSSAGASCPLQTSLPDGLNTVEWRLDPAGEPLTPDSTRVDLLVTELECVGGQPMGDRLLGPEIVVTDDEVLVAFAAEPPPGDMQECPGNPETPVTVDLGQPLGDRDLTDGLAVAGNLVDHLD